MIQTLQGYFQEGRFMSTQQNTIPDFVEVYVIVTNKTIPKSKAVQQRQAFEQFIQAIESSEHPLGDEFDEVINQGVDFCGELEV